MHASVHACVHACVRMCACVSTLTLACGRCYLGRCNRYAPGQPPAVMASGAERSAAAAVQEERRSTYVPHAPHVLHVLPVVHVQYMGGYDALARASRCDDDAKDCAERAARGECESNMDVMVGPGGQCR